MAAAAAAARAGANVTLVEAASRARRPVRARRPRARASRDSAALPADWCRRLAAAGAEHPARSAGGCRRRARRRGRPRDRRHRRRRPSAADHGARGRRGRRRMGRHPEPGGVERAGARGRLGRRLDRPRRRRDAGRGGPARVAGGRGAAGGRDRAPVPARLLPRAARAARRHDPAPPRARDAPGGAVLRSLWTHAPSRCPRGCARSCSRSAASRSTISCQQLAERGIAVHARGRLPRRALARGGDPRGRRRRRAPPVTVRECHDSG